MKDTILVFGTTYNQVPMIRKIQEMGFHAWATSAGDCSSCDGVADRILDVDTSDADALLEIVQKEGIRGLLTCGTSTAICTIAYINEKLDLSRKVIPYEVALNATIKENFQRILAPAGIVPRGDTAASAEEAVEKSRALALPIVLKPVDGGGGKGVEVVEERSRAALHDAFARSLAYSRAKRLMVEEYIAGVTLGVESITLDGVTHVLAVAEKSLAGFPNCVTTGVFFPSPRLEPHLEKIAQVNREAIARLGIEWGPTHIDMVLRDGGAPCIVDVGPRLAGGPIASTLIESATGYDLYGAAIGLGIGEDVPAPCIDRTQTAVYGSHFIVRDESGTISAIGYDRERASDLGLLDFRLLKRAGDRIDGIVTDGDRLAVFHLSAATREEMLEKIRAAEDAFRLEVS